MTYTELEKAYIDLTYAMEKQALKVIGACGNNNIDRAGAAAVTLCDMAADARNQYQMRQEQAGSYDLAALKVIGDTLSNSETGWERED